MDTIEYKGYKINIEREEDPLNPRGDDFDCNLGTLVALHKRYNLSDKTHLSDGSKLRSEDYAGWDAMIAHVDKVEEGIISLPVYMYDHSGITINTTGFNCPWDSGQLGFIYVSKEKARKMYSWKIINKKRIETLKGYLRSEIETYDQYLTDDVYRYTTVLPDESEVDSCGGYYGHDHEKSGLMEAAKNAIDADIVHKAKQ